MLACALSESPDCPPISPSLSSILTSQNHEEHESAIGVLLVNFRPNPTHSVLSGNQKKFHADKKLTTSPPKETFSETYVHNPAIFTKPPFYSGYVLQECEQVEPAPQGGGNRLRPINLTSQPLVKHTITTSLHCQKSSGCSTFPT